MKILKNKKATLSYLYDWPELYSFLLLIIGFIVAISMRNTILNSLVIVMAGFLGGRLLYEAKVKETFPYLLILVGFLLGYMLGSFYTSRRLILFLFLISVWITYYLHKKEVFHIVPL